MKAVVNYIKGLLKGESSLVHESREEIVSTLSESGRFIVTTIKTKKTRVLAWSLLVVVVVVVLAIKFEWQF